MIANAPATGACALAGTDTPFLAAIGVSARKVMLRRPTRPYIAVDDRGVWLTFGRYANRACSRTRSRRRAW
ncbi:hypothetical protein [Streptomyces rimosus]|uniref:hypothetical protein n=1 Tax=Streptomyces rimosus TaxID=1927 RepID=UPI0037D75FA2